MREKKKGDKHTHRVDHHAFAVRDEGRGHLCSRARSDVYAVHVKLRAATTHTTSARVFAAAPCFPPCVACRCWLFLSRHGRHGSHAKTNEKERKRNRAWIVQRTTEARSERAEDPWSKRCCLSDGTAFSAAVCDPRRPSSSFLVAPRLVSAALVAFRPFPSLEFLPRLALIPHLCVLPYSLTRLTCSFSSSISRFSKPLLPCVTPSLFLSSITVPVSFNSLSRRHRHCHHYSRRGCHRRRLHRRRRLHHRYRHHHHYRHSCCRRSSRRHSHSQRVLSRKSVWFLGQSPAQVNLMTRFDSPLNRTNRVLSLHLLWSWRATGIN